MLKNTETNSTISFAQEPFPSHTVDTSIGFEGEDLELHNLRNEVMTDELTGVMSRKGVGIRLDQMLKSGSAVAVAFIDLDHFKEINDTYGHERGDEILKDFAYELKETLRTSDMVARGRTGGAGRLGGDEFVGIAQITESRENLHPEEPDLDHEWTEEDGFNGYYEHLVDFSNRWLTKHQDLVDAVGLGVSIGLASNVGQDAMHTAGEILHHADENMYAVKQAKGSAR